MEKALDSRIKLVDNPYEIAKYGLPDGDLRDMILKDSHRPSDDKVEYVPVAYARYALGGGRKHRIIRGGSPTGTGAINERNLPNAAYEINPALFMAYTQRQTFNPSNLLAATPANYVTKTLLQVGIVARLRVLIQGAIVVASAASNSAVTPTFKWPYGYLTNVALTGNQQNNFIACSGFDLHQRKVVQLRAFIDGYTVAGIAPAGLSGTAANGTYPFLIVLDIPIAMDMTTLVGALYAQSEATNLTVTFTTEAIANLFTATNGAVVTIVNTAGTAGTVPTIQMEETIFSIPYHPQKSNVLVIPDLTVLHGLIANNNAIASQSSVTTELYRSNANLERLFFYTDDNNTMGLTTTYYSGMQLLYGAAEQPYGWTPPDFKRIEDNANNRVIMTDGSYVLDLTADNPARDQVILEGVTNLRLITNYLAGKPASASAKVHWVQETLFA
jgi:hypothetical protein